MEHFNNYRVLPMGLLSASAAFQRWVEGRLKKHNLLWQRVNSSHEKKYIYPSKNVLGPASMFVF
jgi:hypothetical protein